MKKNFKTFTILACLLGLILFILFAGPEEQSLDRFYAIALCFISLFLSCISFLGLGLHAEYTLGEKTPAPLIISLIATSLNIALLFSIFELNLIVGIFALCLLLLGNLIGLYECLRRIF